MVFKPSVGLRSNWSIKPTADAAAYFWRYAPMKEPYQPNASILQAALAAPAVTPVIAIPLVSLLPGVYASPVIVLITIPVTFVLAILFGYLGMAVVCLPLYALLRRANQLRAIRLCSYTTVLGTVLWVLFWQWGESMASDTLTTYVVIGATCSLAVAASFCWLAGITIRPSGRRTGAA